MALHIKDALQREKVFNHLIVKFKNTVVAPLRLQNQHSVIQPEASNTEQKRARFYQAQMETHAFLITDEKQQN